MEQKVCLITGASSGIGQGVALVMAEQGYDIALTYGKNKEGALKTQSDVLALGRRCEIYEAHMEDPSAPSAFVDAAVAALGRVDVMVCNAAIDRRHSVLTVTPEELTQIMQVDFSSYMLLAGAAARHMVRQKTAGSIFFVTSTHSMRAYADDFSYGGMKAAVMRACESLALDLSPYGIRVICVAPGATRVRPIPENYKPTHPIEDVIPLRRMGTPRDNGELIAFLSSDKASYITGVSIRVDGGLILSGPPEGWSAGNWLNPAWTQRHYDAFMGEAPQ